MAMEKAKELVSSSPVLFFRSDSYQNCSEHDSGLMAPKKVDALEEKLKGEVDQLKFEVEEQISTMEGRFSNLEDMMKKILELHIQPTTSEVRALVHGQRSRGNPNISTMGDDPEVEILGDRKNMPPLKPITRREMGEGYGMRRNWEEEMRRADFEEEDIYEGGVKTYCDACKDVGEFLLQLGAKYKMVELDVESEFGTLVNVFKVEIGI
ncbi:hypothetical protein M5K25_002828 [Dendrobium thyrsiflorum]|uniref:Uncharacterized protein n=1 Tax=Dendrobium thyrsiflorum TaxID=117978 RepID=A0ABD0VNB4_DENTH